MFDVRRGFSYKPGYFCGKGKRNQVQSNSESLLKPGTPFVVSTALQAPSMNLILDPNTTRISHTNRPPWGNGYRKERDVSN